jgi:hypothetical protein
MFACSGPSMVPFDECPTKYGDDKLKVRAVVEAVRIV